VKGGSWEWVERPRAPHATFVLAFTERGEVLLTEEFCHPVGASVVSLPAGLVGDEREESPEEAARRELCEETGYSAERLELLGAGPTSPGVSSEIATIFLARDVRKTGAPNGKERSRIRLHAIPSEEVASWLKSEAAKGTLIDPKIWAALYLATT
jgi:ADP-ribose pyrophosphatase